MTDNIDPTKPAPEFPTETPNKWLKNPATRAWIYGIAAAIGALVLVIVPGSEEIVGRVLDVVAAALVLGGASLAIVNRPR